MVSFQSSQGGQYCVVSDIGRCSGWASVIAYRGRTGYYALDALARELDMTADELIAQIGSDAERGRLQAIV